MGGRSVLNASFPKCIARGPGGAAFSPSIRLGFQMFLGNGLSACIILLLLLLTALGGGIQRNRHCVIAHIAQITNSHNRPVAYTWATTQMQRNWCLLWHLGQTRCSFDCHSGYKCFDVSWICCCRCQSLCPYIWFLVEVQWEEKYSVLFYRTGKIE